MRAKSHLVWIGIFIAIILAAVLRLIPHAPNFTPIGALALFSGAILLNRTWTFLLPIGGLFLGDTLLEIVNPGSGFYPGMELVYASFFMIILLGIAIRNNPRPLNILGASVAGSLIFFLVSNFNYWYGGVLYPQNFAGFIQSYVAGLAFFRNTLLADLFYNSIFFGTFYLASRRFANTAKA